MTDYDIAYLGDEWRVFDNHTSELHPVSFSEYQDAENYAEAWLVDKGY